MATTSQLSLYLLFLAALQLRVAFSEDDFATVTIPQGTLKGKKVTPTSTAAYYSFQGIPYAKPPVGELRFKAPSDPDPWNGTFEALQEGAECKQFDLLDKMKKGEEDCLFLNIYTPQLPDSSPLKPVMVYVHGGGFAAGSGNKKHQNPELLIDTGVVYVSFNYRLGPFGFLTTQDSAIPGNAGMKDQVQALRWIQKNIAAFGGDPNRVTIFGESAGGASVHYLMLSPMTEGLFQGAIAQSGSVLSPWALAVKPRDTAFQIGTALGFSGNTSQELADFLRNLDAETLLDTSLTVKPEIEEYRLLSMVHVPSQEPAVEGEESFLPDHPLRLLEEGRFHKVPFISGVTSSEGLVFIKFGGLLDGSRTEREINENFSKMLKRDVRGCNEVDNCDELIARIKSFYFEDQPYSMDLIEKFVELMSDVAFNEGLIQSLNVMSNHTTTPLYMYQFSYDGGFGLLKKLFGLENFSGVNHGEDLGYLFKYGLEESNDPMDIKVRSQFIRLWTNFAKTGNPTSGITTDEVPEWIPYKQSETNYLEIGPQMVIKRDLFKNRIDFLNQLYNESRFSLQNDSRRTLIWRETGSRYNRRNIVERDQYGGGGVMVWGGNLLNGRTDLHIFFMGSPRNTVNARRYRDEILRSHVRLFRGTVCPEFLLMDNNARPHRAPLVDEFLAGEHIHRMDWPAWSADLNPIENAWDALGRRIASRQPHQGPSKTFTLPFRRNEIDCHQSSWTI
ncbi:juvenile hormone esterase-like [Anabrus simplex]|uniref:juvenile hormone esterase-like n=1 Tax=Anabrus simplex TaxID=316456 RepID=UPI0035A3574B